MTKVFWKKVNWEDFLQKIFAIHFTCSESCALSKVNCKQQKSIGTQNKWIGTSTYGSSNWLLLVAIDFTQSTWFTTSKVNCKIFLYFCATSFQFTFSLQFTLVICTWSGPWLGIHFHEFFTFFSGAGDPSPSWSLRHPFWPRILLVLTH